MGHVPTRIYASRTCINNSEAILVSLANHFHVSRCERTCRISYRYTYLQALSLAKGDSLCCISPVVFSSYTGWNATRESRTAWRFEEPRLDFSRVSLLALYVPSFWLARKLTRYQQYSWKHEHQGDRISGNSYVFINNSESLSRC